MNISDLKQYVIGWNLRFPLDRWWRIKHNVSFMSPVHRESSFINQLIEFEEDKFFSTLPEEEKSEYIPGVGDIFKNPSTLEDFSKEADHEIDEILKLENNHDAR